MTSGRPLLRRLAQLLGVADGYESARTRRWHESSDETRAALVRAMGHRCESEAEAGRALEALEQARRACWLAPVRVARAAELRQSGLLLAESGLPGARLRFEATLRSEDGELRVERAGELAPGERAIALPEPLGIGEYELKLRLHGGGSAGGERSQRLLVVPETAFDPTPQLAPGGAFGLIAQLYVLRDRRGWSAGDLGTLRRLCELAGREGAAFVGLNPLHALANRPGRVCPYWPLSRLHRNPVYLELEAIPEWARCEPARRLASRSGPDAARPGAGVGSPVDLPAVARAKRAVLELLFDEFERERGTADDERAADLERRRARADASLEGFATYLAIAESLETTADPRGDPWSWHHWPAALRDPGGDGVRDFRRRHARAVRFHEWCQLELDRQLELAAQRARSLGLGLGLYTDLALGSATGGADEWLHRHLFADASAGAPPDDFAPEGQDWCLPPLDPHALAADGYRFFQRLLRAAFAHAGALRLDHALALRRLFWVPRGRTAGDGAYVAYPESDLLGVLALESQRAGAAVIGEDLGTVPPGFRERMQAQGLLSSRVLLFEHGADGLAPASSYPRLALATASTHDLPPLAAWRGDDDLRLRRRVGHIADDEALARERDARERLRADLRSGLSRGEPGAAGRDPLASDAELGACVTRFLCSTPALLVGLAVDDLTGEREPLNLPGIPPEGHESWRRPLSVPVEEIATHPVARATLEAVPEARRSRSGRARAQLDSWQ